VNEGVILSEVDREAINFVEGSAVAFRNFRFGGDSTTIIVSGTNEGPPVSR
jgi:hypothetical protein